MRAGNSRRDGFLAPDGPTQFRRRSSWVAPDFLQRRSDYLIRHAGIEALTLALLEGFFDTAILSRMKGQDCDAPPRVKAGWKKSQECFQRRELFIHRHAQRLKYAGHGCIRSCP